MPIENEIQHRFTAGVYVQGALLFERPEDKVVNQTTGSSYTIDVRDGSMYDLTVDSDVTFSFDGASETSGGNLVTVILRQDATGGRSINWPTDILWNAGSAPSLSTNAGDISLITFVTPNGGTDWIGLFGGTGFA